MMENYIEWIRDLKEVNVVLCYDKLEQLWEELEGYEGSDLVRRGVIMEEQMKSES